MYKLAFSDIVNSPINLELQNWTDNATVEEMNVKLKIINDKYFSGKEVTFDEQLIAQYLADCIRRKNLEFF